MFEPIIIVMKTHLDEHETSGNSYMTLHTFIPSMKHKYWLFFGGILFHFKNLKIRKFRMFGLKYVWDFVF